MEEIKKNPRTKISWSHWIEINYEWYDSNIVYYILTSESIIFICTE